MTDKRYLSLDGLSLYDEKTKKYLSEKDEKVLADSKEYFDSMSENFDIAGSSATVRNELNIFKNEFSDHANNSNIHFTSDERTKLAGIATGANKYTHPNSGVIAGTYKSVTVNAQGHVTGGSNPTTLAGYGITDAEKSGSVNTHNTSTSAHNDIRKLISNLSTKVNNFLDVDNTTTDQLSELIALINENKTDIESITSGKVNVSDIVNNLTTNVSNKPLSAAQGVAIKSLIDALQTAVNGKANSSHGTHVTFATTTPLVAGTASVGTASTVSRGDHVHPVQTSVSGNAGTATKLANSKTIQTNLASTSATGFDGSSNITIGVTGTLPIANGGTGSTTASGALSNLGLTATATELNYCDGVTSAIQTQLNAKQPTITGGATTITGSNLTTSRALVSDANGKVAVSEITSTELGYLDCVTSNIQTQLNGKASSSHSHSSSNITSGYLNIHPENNPTVIPFINNDIAFLDKRGGAFSYYTTTDTDFTVENLAQTSMTLTNPSNMFDGTQTYTSLPTSTTYTMVIDLTLHKTFAYSSIFYIDFGSNGWRAKNISVYVMNKETETKYTQKGSITGNEKGNWYANVSHTSINASGSTVQGFNRLRIVISDFANGSNRRIAQIGLINYSSSGISEVAISRGGCSGIYGNLIPQTTNNVDLGSSSKVWKNIYATTFTGALSGNASTASKLATARNISLTGAVTGSGSFDGSGDLSITTTASNSPKMYVYTVTATTDNQKTFTIPLSGFSTTTDSVLFQSGRTMLLYKEDFTVSGTTITLTEGVPKNRVCGIYVLKNVPFGN